MLMQFTTDADREVHSVCDHFTRMQTILTVIMIKVLTRPGPMAPVMLVFASSAFHFEIFHCGHYKYILF